MTTNKTDCQDITEILLKVELNTITLTPVISVDECMFCFKEGFTSCEAPSKCITRSWDGAQSSVF